MEYLEDLRSRFSTSKAQSQFGPITRSTSINSNPLHPKINFKVVSEHGENLFYLPHGLSTDHDGNFWVTDVGSHQVTILPYTFPPTLTYKWSYSGSQTGQGFQDHDEHRRKVGARKRRKALLQTDRRSCGRKRILLRGRRLLQRPRTQVRPQRTCCWSDRFRTRCSKVKKLHHYRL